MVILCDQTDVEARLKRTLTTEEVEYLGGMIEEAQDLVLSFLNCPPGKFESGAPDAVRRITSRLVARVIQEGTDVPSQDFGATQVGMTAGPFSRQATFSAGARTGAPWLTKVDKDVLAQYRCAGAFSVDLIPPWSQFAVVPDVP